MTANRNTLKQLNALRRWREIQQAQSSALLMQASAEKKRSEQALSQANAALLLAQQQQRLQRQIGRELDPLRYENQMHFGDIAAAAVDEKREQLTQSESRLKQSRQQLNQAQIKLEISETLLDRKQSEFKREMEKREFGEVMDKQFSAGVPKP